jgi:hypothetical protein
MMPNGVDVCFAQACHLGVEFESSLPWFRIDRSGKQRRDARPLVFIKHRDLDLASPAV